MYFFFFFNDTATTEIYTLSLHDALPICLGPRVSRASARTARAADAEALRRFRCDRGGRWYARDVQQLVRRQVAARVRSEEHTSELQSRQYLVCRLLLEKKKNEHITVATS